MCSRTQTEMNRALEHKFKIRASEKQNRVAHDSFITIKKQLYPDEN